MEGVDLQESYLEHVFTAADHSKSILNRENNDARPRDLLKVPSTDRNTIDNLFLHGMRLANDNEKEDIFRICRFPAHDYATGLCKLLK